MEGDLAGCSEYTKGSVEQEYSVEGTSLARDLVKNHNDHDLKADVDHIIKEKESVNIDVEKNSLSKEETELGQNNNVERIVSLRYTGKDKNKSADLKREKTMQTCINTASEITLSENKVEEDQDLSMDFKDRNTCVVRQVTQKPEHVLEMHETVHSEDYEDCINLKIKIGNTDVNRTDRLTVSSNFVSVRGWKMVNKVYDLLIILMSIFQNKSHFAGNQPALPFKEIQVDGSRSIIICNPQVYDWIQSLTRIAHRMQADQGSQGAFIEQWQGGFCFLLEFFLLFIAVFNSDNSCIVAEDAYHQLILLFTCQLRRIKIQVEISGKLLSMCVEPTCPVSPGTLIILICRGESLPVMSQNDMGQITTGFSGRESSTALCHSSKLKAVLPLEDRNLDKKSHGKQCACRRENCGDKKVQPSILRVITPRSLLIPHHMSNSHHEVPKITVPRETLQPTGVHTEQGDKLLAISHNQSKGIRLLCEEFMCGRESIQPIYSISRNNCNFELPCNPSTYLKYQKLPSMLVERRVDGILNSSPDLSFRGTAYDMKPDMTCILMCNQRRSKDPSFEAIKGSCNIFAVHGGKEWTSYNKSFWSSDGKSQVDSEKWYLNLSQDHPCFSNGIIDFAVPFGPEPLPPRPYIAQNDNRYNYESVRLATFSQYQGSGFGTRLAQSGFVYDASRNMVVCPWDGSDVSSEITRNQHGMSCAFVRQFYQINIPLHEAPSPPLPAAFGFDMAATITFSPATEEQLDRIQLQTETDSTEVASREEPNQNAGSGLRQSSEGVNAADIGPIGLTEQEETNCTVHQPENSNADAISVFEEGECGGDSQIDPLRENRILRYAELCKSCEMEPKCAVFVPCGHRLFCLECATSFRRCPICGKRIKNILSASFTMP